MITVQLNNLKFHAFHGVHEEEKILGNEYELSAAVEFHEEGLIYSIRQTINYVDIYQLIKKRMVIPSELLETIVMDIGNSIRKKYTTVRSISIYLKKLHPPIAGIQGSVGVSWHKEY